MYKIKRKCIIITLLALIFSSTVVFAAESNIPNNVNNSENVINNTEENDSTATTILKIKDEQLKSLDDYKTKYGSDTYGFAAYVLHMIQVYSIPIGLVGIAVCAIYQYVIGLKRLDVRDKGFHTMIAMVTILIICQVLPLIFAVVIKSND
ncbi:MAG: hypothetical protein IJH12_02235 [Clostridia bacterium]|nr:hypothetical protein [Clostridia bacterium]